MATNKIPATIKYDVYNNPFLLVQTDKKRKSMQGFERLQGDVWKAPLTPINYNALMQDKQVRRIKPMEGYRFPAPVKIKPRHNQPITAAFLVANKRCWCLNGMRSGKTLSASWASDYLIRAKVIKRVLVLAPLTILHDVWEPALMSVAPHRRVFVASGSVDELITVCNDKAIDIIVINHDKLKLALTAIDQGFDPDLIILDEGGPFRDANSNRTKSLMSLCGVPGISETRKTRRRFWAMTASPNPQKPTDVWALARIINPAVVPATFKSFREKTMYTPIMGKWVPRADWQDHVQEALKPSICFATEDCIDLPPQDYVKRHVPFTPKQSRMMKDLMKDGVTFLKNVDAGKVDHRVAAVNAAVRLVKILQIAGGVVLNDERQPVKVGANKRIAELVHIMNEVLTRPDSKVVIMCVYQAIQPYIQKQLQKHGYGSVIINGKSSGNKRKEALDTFRKDNNIRALISHPEVSKYGLDLTPANTMIWYLPTYKSDEFIQGNARCQGPKTKKKRKTSVIMLEGSAQERHIYKQRLTQDLAQQDTVSVFRGMIAEMQSNL